MDGKRVKAIIFDLDNTLIETRRAGEVAVRKVIMSHLSQTFQDNLNSLNWSELLLNKYSAIFNLIVKSLLSLSWKLMADCAAFKSHGKEIDSAFQPFDFLLFNWMCCFLTSHQNDRVERRCEYFILIINFSLFQSRPDTFLWNPEFLHFERCRQHLWALSVLALTV